MNIKKGNDVSTAILTNKVMSQWEYLDIVNDTKAKIDKLEKEFKESHSDDDDKISSAPDKDFVLYELCKFDYYNFK